VTNRILVDGPYDSAKRHCHKNCSLLTARDIHLLAPKMIPLLKSLQVIGMAICFVNGFLVYVELQKLSKIDETGMCVGTWITHFVSFFLHIGMVVTFEAPRKHKKTKMTAMSIGLVIHSAILLTALLCLAFNGEIPVWIPVPSWHSTEAIFDPFKLKLDQKTNLAFLIYCGLFALVFIDVILMAIVFEKDEPTLPQHMTPSLLESERSIQDGIPMIVEQPSFRQASPQGLPSEATSAPAGDCS
jgi:hypothetical protein